MAFKISLSYLSELISYFPTSLYSVTGLIFHITHGKQRPRTFSYPRMVFSHAHKVNSLTASKCLLKYHLPSWKLQFSHTFPNSALLFFPALRGKTTYCLLIYSLYFSFFVIILAPLKYKVHVGRMFWSVLVHRYIPGTKN